MIQTHDFVLLLLEQAPQVFKFVGQLVVAASKAVVFLGFSCQLLFNVSSLPIRAILLLLHVKLLSSQLVPSHIQVLSHLSSLLNLPPEILFQNLRLVSLILQVDFGLFELFSLLGQPLLMFDVLFIQESVVVFQVVIFFGHLDISILHFFDLVIKFLNSTPVVHSFKSTFFNSSLS